MKTVFKRLKGLRALCGQYVLVLLLGVTFSANAQSVIDQQSFGGSFLPAGWTGNDVVVGGGYAKFAAVNASLTTPSYNLSSYNSVNLSFELANETAADGGPVTVSVSADGGNTYTAQTITSPSPTGVFFVNVSNALTVFASDVKINFSKRGGVGALKFKDFNLQGVLQPKLMLNGSLQEDQLNTSTFVAELTVGTFVPTLNRNGFTLVNVPAGISIASVVRTSDTQARITIAHNGADFDSNISMGLNVAASQITQNLAVSSYNTVPVVAHVEEISIINPVRYNLNYFVGNGPSIAKSFRIISVNLAPGAGNLSVFGNSNYEVSLSPNSNFGPSVTIAYDAEGVLAYNTFYVRLKFGLSVGTYNTNVITLTGGKAATQVVVNGKVIGTAITNDLCANAETIDSFMGDITGTLASSTYTALTQGDNAKDVWYKFVANCPGNYTISLSDFSGNADLFLFQGSCPLALTQAVASSQTSTSQEVIEYYISQAGTYYIRVAAMNAAAEAPFHLNFHKNAEAPVILYSGTVSNISASGATIQAAPQILCDALFYGVEYSTTQGFTPGTGTQVMGGALTDGAYTVSLAGLTDGTQYYFRVWEYNTTIIGYGSEQTFTTTQNIIGTESVIVPVVQQPSNVTMSGLRAKWFMPGQYNFKLNVSTSPVFDTYVLNEDFSGFAADGAVPVINADTRFHSAGWAVSNVFEGSGVAVIGAAGQVGAVTSPAIDLSGLTGETYLSVDLAKYQLDNTTVKVLYAADGTNFTQLGTNLAALNTPHTYVFALTGGTANSRIKIQSSGDFPATRFILDNVAITNYTGTTQSLSYTTVAPTAVAGTVNGVSGNTFYRTLSGLTGSTTYYYRVRAESNGMFSAPSEVKQISTLGMNIQNGVLYVRKDQGGTGESWASPMSELADALYLAKQLNDAAPATVRQIWVASGKYRPFYRADNYSNADANDRDNAFVLLNGVSLYGGFAGFESSVNNRQYLPLATGVSGGETLLTGKVGLEEIETDNLYHIIVGSGITAASGVVVDGFIIRDAYADGTGDITVNGNAIARNNGGGVYNKNSEYELRNVLIQENFITGKGGGVYNENCLSGMIINNAQINNNHANSGAGVANISGMPVIKGSTLKNNFASAHGGAVYNDGAGSVIKDLSVLIGNDALSGGGIYNVHSTTYVYNSTITANESDYGAGVFNAVSNATVFDRVKIKDNLAARLGGAFYIEGDSDAVVSGADSFTNCIVTGNNAQEKGGALYYVSGSNALFSGINAGPIFTNCTFDQNIASGEGRFMYYGNAGAAQAPAVFRNSIVMNNNGATFVDTSGAGGLDAVIFKNVLTDATYLGANNNTGNNILASDPLFSNASVGDYTLDTNSPAVNSGLADYYSAGLVPDLFAVTKDFAGNDRVYDGFVDLGAYEWQEAAPCAITTVWDGTSWSNGEPESIEYAAVFDGDYTSSGSLTACSIAVNSGVITIASGHTLRVKGAVFVDDAAQLIIEDNAALLQVNNVVNTGNITFNKKSNQLYRYDYTLWSSPVANQRLLDFSPSTTSNRYYEYKYGFNGTDWLEAYWHVDPLSTSFAPAKGYLIRMPNLIPSLPGYGDGDTATEFNGVFKGVPNNGNININLSAEGDRYTAVGNPYPSPINVYDFFATNANVIDVTSGVYFWRKRNNSAATSYATLTMAAFVANPALGGGAGQAQYYNGPASTWLLAPGQGFIVRTKTGVTTPVLKFTNKMRRGTPGASQAFLRNAATPAAISRYWINMLAADGSFASQFAVAYMDETTNQFDYGYDAKVLQSEGNAIAYTMQNETPLAIQARAVFANTDRVAMGYTSAVAGSYTINLQNAQGIFGQGQTVYLKDNVTGIVTNLTAGDYIFNTGQGTFNNRFELFYTTETLGTTNPEMGTNAGVVVYKKGNSLVINAENSTIKAVDVYDITGRLVYSNSAVNAPSVTVDRISTEQQMLIVNTTTDAGKSTKKIIF